MAAIDDATSYYGYLFDAKRQPTKVLDALLRGIAGHIIEKIGDTSDKWLRPEKMAAFYRAVGGNYDSFFVDTPPTSISWIYASIGCEHILLPTDDAYVPPSVPSLTMAGFVRWQCIEILLGPEEHVPFIQESLRLFEIIHPETNIPFPTNLPTDAFPLIPDQATERWHENCAKLLRLRSITPEKENSLSSKPKYKNSNCVHEDSYPQEDSSSCSKEYEHPGREIRPRPANFRCFSNFNVRSASGPGDLRHHEIVVEAEPNASQKSRQQNFRRKSLPNWAKEQGDKSSEITKSKSGGEFTARFGIHNNKPKFLHSRHSHNFEGGFHSSLSNSTHHLKVETQTKPYSSSLRLNHQTRYPSAAFSTQNSRRKSSKTEEKCIEEYVRLEQVRNASPETTIYKMDKCHLHSSHDKNVKWKNKVPVFAVHDDTLIENIRESVRNRTFFPNIDRDTNSSVYVGKKIKNFDEKLRRKNFKRPDEIPS